MNVLAGVVLIALLALLGWGLLHAAALGIGALRDRHHDNDIEKVREEARRYRDALHTIVALSAIADPDDVPDLPPSVAVALDEMRRTANKALNPKELP